MTFDEINEAKSQLNSAAKQFYGQSKVNSDFSQGSLVDDLNAAYAVRYDESELSRQLNDEINKFGKLFVAGCLIGGVSLLFTIGNPFLMVLSLLLIGVGVFGVIKKKAATKKKKGLGVVGLVNPTFQNFVVPFVSLFRDDFDPSKKATIQYDTNYTDQQKYQTEKNKFQQKRLGFKFVFEDKSVLELDLTYFLKSKYKKRKGKLTSWKEVLVLRYTKKGEHLSVPKAVVGDFVVVPGDGKFTIKTKAVRRAEKKLRPDELLAYVLKLIGQISQTLKSA